MRHILERHAINWPHTDKLHISAERVQHIITELDAVAVKYEKLWGVDRLPKLVSQATYDKWVAQMDKLNLALEQNDAAMVQELAAGCIRGWQVMDAEAKTAGHKPPSKPEAWLCRMGQRTLAIVATEDDAAVYAAHLEPDANVVIWPLQAIADLVGEKYSAWDDQIKRCGTAAQVEVVKEQPAGEFDDDVPF
jgi:hypothetical protein